VPQREIAPQLINSLRKEMEGQVVGDLWISSGPAAPISHRGLVAVGTQEKGLGGPRFYPSGQDWEPDVSACKLRNELIQGDEKLPGRARQERRRPE